MDIKITGEVFNPWNPGEGEGLYEVVEDGRLLQTSGVSLRSAQATLRRYSDATDERRNYSIRPETTKNRKTNLSAFATDDGSIIIQSNIQNSPFRASDDDIVKFLELLNLVRRLPSDKPSITIEWEYRGNIKSNNISDEDMFRVIEQTLRELRPTRRIFIVAMCEPPQSARETLAREETVRNIIDQFKRQKI